MWRDWERWAADVAESHTNYPVLIHVRSAQPNRNWLVALLAVLGVSPEFVFAAQVEGVRK